MSKADLYLSSPLLNAAGFLGFAPELREVEDIRGLGAFITNPVSLERRTPAGGARFLPFASGFLMHTGYPNPGLRAVLHRHARAWSRSPIQVIVHLLGQEPAAVKVMVNRLEAVEGVAGIEIGIPPGIDRGAAFALVEAAQGELPIIARLPFESAIDLAEAVVAAGAWAVNLGAPRGSLPGTPGGALAQGRLYGPAVFPQALHVVRQIAALQVPVIGAGGVYRQEQVSAMLEAGATAVQLDGVLWRGGWTGA